DGIAGRSTVPVGDQGAGRPAGDVPLPRGPAVEEVVQKARAARVAEELRAVADQAPRRNPVLEPDATGAVIDHLDHLALAGADLLRDAADELLRAVDHEVLHRLEPPLGAVPGDD